MKRLVYIIFVLTCCLISAQAQTSGSCGDNLYWSIVDSTLTIDGSGVMYGYDYANPAPWEEVKSRISTVVLSEKLTNIGDYAFASCSNLKYITLPNQLDSIGDGAFSSCISLKNIIIPAHVSSIQWAPFYNCSNLSSITVESANPVYDSRNNCNAIIESATNTLVAGCHATVIPNNVTCIGSYAFLECHSLYAITIPSSVDTIQGAAFVDCSVLTTVYVEATEPPVLEYNDIFTSAPTCYIPTGTLAEYQESNWASQVGSFVEEGGTTNVLSCTQAAELCTSTTPTTETYTIRGYVTQITQEYSSNYNNITFWMADEVDGGQVLMAYRVQPTSTTDQAVKVGDYVEVVGSLQLYSTTPEVAQGGSYTILNASPSPENKCGDNLYWTLQDSTLIITGSGAMYDYYSSKNIPWNDLRSSIKNVSFPNGMTSIAFSSFYECINLRSITIPNSVTNIYTNNPFNFCPSLISIEVMSGNTTYDSREGCNAIIETATNTLIIGCQNTTIPQSVTSIGERAFEGCSNLNSINIHKNILSIGIHSFANCYAVTSIIVEDGNAVYDSREGCNAIIETATNTLITGCQTTVIPSTITTIGDYAFSNRTSNNPIVIPNGVTTINEGAFWCCRFESITIPESVTSIGRQAFAYSSSLTSIYVKSITPPTLGSSVFSSSPTCYIPAGTLAAYQASDWASQVGSFVEQEEVILTCVEAVEMCTSTTPTSEAYTIRGYVTQIVYEYSSSYNDVTFWIADEIDGGQVLYVYRAHPISTIDQAVKVGDYIEIVGSLQLYNNIPEVAPSGSYTILNAAAGNLCGANLYWEYDGGTLTIKGEGAMFDYSRYDAPWDSYRENITAISLSSGITTIGNYAFSDITNLAKISMPSTLLSIGKNAFYHCASLSSITIPANVDTIVPFAFAGCSALTSINVHAKNTTYDSRNSCNAVIHTATNTLAVGCQNTVIPADVVKIGDAAFERATFSYIEIPNTVTEIAQYAFYGCEYLTTIDLPDNLTTLGYAAFRHCYALNEVVIPSTVTQVEGSTFSGCTSLTSIVVESGNTKYDSRNSCNAIIETATNTLIAGCQNTVIPNNVTSIGSQAFYQCSSLTSITIPNNVTSIGIQAFSSCSSLTSITVEATTPPTLGTYVFTSSPICYIPCGTLAAYQASAWANQVGSFEDECSDSTMITYELNGGVTNDYGWMNKNDMFQACMADCSVTELPSLDEIKALADPFTTICGKLTDVTRMLNAEKWDWLETYIMSVQNADASATALTEGTTSAGWRYALAAFFLESKRVVWPVSADFSQAGTVQAFMPVWQHGFSNPTNPTASFTLNAPYKEGYTFDGWYATADFSGTALTTIDASTTGTLYAKWIEGTVTTPSADKYYTFDDASLNAEWQFIQSGQTNYWTIGTAAGSASTGSNALYITNNGSSYAYTVTSASVSWAYIPVTLETNETISFKWKGTAESCCDYLAVYLMPVGSLPTAGSTNLPDGTITLTGNLNQQSEWQTFSTTINAGEYNLCFMWRNDGSVGNTSIAVDDVTIGENTSSTPAEGQCGDNLYWSYANGTLSITGSGAMYDFSDEDVPWKDFRGAITSVSLPYGLTTIGTYAFAHCRVLSSITLPTTLTIIGDYAFYDCDALINMVIPESVTTIGNNAFLYCDALSNVTLPSGITHVEDNAFASCPSLTTITIPYGVTTIGNYAFYDCDALTTVNMPNSLVTIGNYAFANCDVLSNITIPNSVTTIGNNAFYSCSVLTSIHLEATTPPAIGSNLFSSAPICYIPCGTLAAYQASAWASQVGSFIEENCEQNDTVYNVYICYGETYTWEVNGETYSSSGVYDYSEYNEAGELMHWILNLTVSPAPVTEEETITIAASELPYIWRGVTIAEAGSYVTTEQSINGCDSVIHELYLIVEANATMYNAYICYGETYTWEVNGTAYSESGTYTYSDSWTGETTAILNLTVSPAPVMDIDNVTINENELPYIWDGYTINAAGGYTYTEESVHGCDSVIHELYLTVESSNSGSTSVYYCDFESSNINAQWQFIQNGQTNYWTIGTGAGSASAGSNALYITNDGYNYSYTNNSVSVSWTYIPVELETSDTISFYWKGTAESSYDNMRVYLYPENSLPIAGSSTASNDAVQVTSTYLCGQSSWQYFTGTPGVAGRYNLCFMWKNDASSGSMPIAVDEIRISQMTVPALPENQCGENLYWAYNNGTLTISGSGAMYDSHELLSYRQQSWFPDAVMAVSLPNGMTHIGATAFADCSNLTSITIPSTVTSIGAEAFAWSGLERITLPESVQDIAEMAFVKCGKMTNFVWRGTPSTLGNVYNHMFLGCNQLDTVIAPARMWECTSANADIHTYYGFPSHIRYVEVTSGELSSNAISYIASSYESLTTLDISAVSNASLPTQAFASWTALETLHLPVNLTVIPYQMVYGCTNLSNISIPNYVQEIGEEAFRGCTKLHSIDFADGQNLLSIGQYAFYNCSTLVSVTVPEGMQTLGAYAFYNNASLVKIKLPSTLNVIGNYAFGNCQQLMKMNVAAYAPPTVSSNTFYAVPRTATVYVPESAINTYKSTYIWNEFFIESNVQDALDNIFTDSEEQVQKLLIHGQVFIIRNGKCYDLMGQEVETEK